MRQILSLFKQLLVKLDSKAWFRLNLSMIIFRFNKVVALNLEKDKKFGVFLHDTDDEKVIYLETALYEFFRPFYIKDSFAEKVNLEIEEMPDDFLTKILLHLSFLEKEGVLEILSSPDYLKSNKIDEAWLKIDSFESLFDEGFDAAACDPNNSPYCSGGNLYACWPPPDSSIPNGSPMWIGTC